MSTSDLLLLQRVQQRDLMAFAQLYDQFSGALYGTVLRVLQGKEAYAQEVLQVVFMNIWIQAAGYDPSNGRPFTWMLNIARSTAIDRMRSPDMQTASANCYLDQHIDPLDTCAGQDHLVSADMVKVLQGMEPEYREIIEMAYYQGLTQQEIAVRTRISLGSVKSRTRAALSAMRALLKDHH
jgi:RNA polymerase sigma factor (sigma-70 family)